MGVFDRARAPKREKPARRDVVDDARARVRRKTREIRDEIDDISATQFILFGASILGAFLLGRRARRADARGTDLDTVAELLKQPYMRELGTPSPRKGLRGVLARARRGVRRRRRGDARSSDGIDGQDGRRRRRARRERRGDND